MRRGAATPADDADWQQELAAWGIDEPDTERETFIPVWPENWPVVQWWLSIPGFLKFNQNACLGMDVLAVKADAELSQRTIEPDDYRKLKTIARTLAEELNRREP
ncbi:hypothetical protein [Vibrio quintilis]|uniref:Uncharacterized protein n=1 Tax=Vibrio quintilis TaxID=1117707 RepID=A0A1M7Z1Z2_9VIBR|nr:hypothetical protein [Vibrio quintilis]SHO58800.1 hypothetical protein VQ7734_04572 [Vibrio quintilis]